MSRVVLVCFVQLACRGDAAPPEFRSGAPLRGESGLYVFEAFMDPEQPALGELVRMRVRVKRASDGAPLAGARLVVDAEMPQHGHGMQTVPRHIEQTEGWYVSEGLRFHMSGEWLIHIEVGGGGAGDRVRCVHRQRP